MAVGTSLLTSGADASNASSYASASIAPSGDALILAFVQLYRWQAEPAITSLSGNGLTWVLEDSDFWFDSGATANDFKLFVYRAMGAAPSSGVVTITLPAAHSACIWSIIECTGVDTSGADGAGAIVQSVTDSGTGASGLVTMAAFADPSNVAVAGFAHMGNYWDADPITEGSGFTELSEDDIWASSESMILQAEHKTNDNTADASWVDSVGWGGIGVEVAIAPPVVVPGETTRVIAEPSRPRVKALRDGRGWDLTEQVEGLQWSSVKDGGDERCRFTVKKDWSVGAPEIAQGNTIRVEDGLDVLGQFRIEENDRKVADSESVGIEALGLGVLLKRESMQGIYVDRDFGRWQGPSVQRKLDAIAVHYAMQSHSVGPDVATGQPALGLHIHGAWASPKKPLIEVYYDAGSEVIIGSIYYAWKSPIGAGDSNWVWQVFGSTDDVVTSRDGTGDLQAAGPGTGTLTMTGDNKRYGEIEFYYGATPAGTQGEEYPLDFTCLAVYGTQGLTKQGTEDATNAKGFHASDIVANIIGRQSGVVARDIDATTFVVEQLAFLQPTSLEQALVDASRFDAVDWGTWGPRSALDMSKVGYFDWKAKDYTTAHWFAHRRECDSVRLNVELASLYNKVRVRYRDMSGVERVITRTASVPLLDELGLTQEPEGGIDAGTSTANQAAQYGDVFLALSGGRSPARGSATISGEITHHRRGRLPAHHMRADGANLRIPDVLPDRDLFSLQVQPDRRSTFPVKRVSVDCSGKLPKTTVEVDQVNDLMSILNARRDLATQLVAA